VADVANFRVAPPPRCGQLERNSLSRFCGRRATHIRLGVGEFPVGYFCPQHSSPGDKIIPASFLFRRVSVQLEVTLAGVSLQPGEAEGDAVGALVRAIERAGGLVNLHTVHSALGRYTPPAQATRGPKPVGGG